LLGGETRQLFPRRIAQPRTRSRSAGLEQRGKVHTVAGRGAAGALRFLVGLATGQRAAGIEQAAVETLLALDRLLVQPPRLQLVRQLARLLRERAGGGAPGSSCSRAAAIWRCAKPSAPSSCGDTSACFPAASRIWRSTAAVPSSTEACRDRVVGLPSPRRSDSATCCSRSASAAVSASARSRASSVS